MNGVHDMGGMQDMGPIVYEKDEPVFHHRWEARVYAMWRGTRAWRKWNIDTGRFTIESLPPAQYLQFSYYERWFAALERLVVRFGMVTAGELASGKAAPDTKKQVPALTVAAAGQLTRGLPSTVDPAIAPLFRPGDRVRARNMNPQGHTRLPRYARGRTGEVVRDHGVHIFPDTNYRFDGEHRQHVYSVRFSARELWGEQASVRDSVYLDLWDNYLERI